MISNYSLFYEYSKQEDSLFIFLDELNSPFYEERKGNVSSLTRDSKFIGYRIYNIKNIVKIKRSGMIFLPNDILIEIINSFLKDQNLELLEKKESSNYVVGKIVDIGEKISVDLKDKVIICELSDRAVIDDLVVIALSGAGLNDKSIVTDEGHICSCKDLDISNDTNPFVLDEQCVVGSDFFLMEAKLYA